MTKKAMSREEIICLLELISEYSVLTNKNTNATTNKLKEEAWISLTDAFNSNYARYPKLKEQLKLKWDNLKRAARKRKHLIRLNRLKVQTGSGKIEYIPEDEVLEKVEYLMGDTTPSLLIPKNNRLRTTARAEIPIISLKDCADAKFQESIGEDLHTCQNEEKNGVMSPVTQFTEEDPLRPKFLYRMPIETTNYHTPNSFSSGKTKWPNDGRREKNLAIAKYFEKKSEKIDLEITLLRMEIKSMKRN